jgi:DNA polymerase III delta subunit
MLTIFAGEDSAASRRSFTSFIDSYKDKNYDIRSVSISEIESIALDDVGVTNLFGQEQIYTVENASKKYKGRVKTPYKTAVLTIAKDKNKMLIDWEDGKSAYDLSTFKRIATDFRESKAERSIFEVLDDCYPGNLRQFLASYHTVLKSSDASFIFAMLCRHIRKLIQAQSSVYEKGSQSWQRIKIDQQARLWDQKKLKTFYDGLARIDISSKSQSSPYDLSESLEVLVCYYLR